MVKYHVVIEADDNKRWKFRRTPLILTKRKRYPLSQKKLKKNWLNWKQPTGQELLVEKYKYRRWLVPRRLAVWNTDQKVDDRRLIVDQLQLFPFRQSQGYVSACFKHINTLLSLVRDSSAIRWLFVQLAGAVGRQSALYKENSGFAASTLGRHVSWHFIFYPKSLYKLLHQSFFYSFITILPSESGVTLEYSTIFT